MNTFSRSVAGLFLSIALIQSGCAPGMRSFLSDGGQQSGQFGSASSAEETRSDTVNVYGGVSWVARKDVIGNCTVRVSYEVELLNDRAKPNHRLRAAQRWSDSSRWWDGHEVRFDEATHTAFITVESNFAEAPGRAATQHIIDISVNEEHLYDPRVATLTWNKPDTCFTGAPGDELSFEVSEVSDAVAEGCKVTVGYSVEVNPVMNGDALWAIWTYGTSAKRGIDYADGNDNGIAEVWADESGKASFTITTDFSKLRYQRYTTQLVRVGGDDAPKSYQDGSVVQRPVACSDDGETNPDPAPTEIPYGDGKTDTTLIYDGKKDDGGSSDPSDGDSFSDSRCTVPSSTAHYKWQDGKCLPSCGQTGSKSWYTGGGKTCQMLHLQVSDPISYDGDYCCKSAPVIHEL